MRSCLVAALLLLAPAAAFADSTNAPVNLAPSTVPFDPAKVTWLSPENLQKVTTAYQDFLAGKYSIFVLAGSPYGAYGMRLVQPEGVQHTVPDMARAALEECEWVYGMPCYLLAVNGVVPLDENGAYLEQEQMLDPEPAMFDYARVPFVTSYNRRVLRDYQILRTKRALAVSPSGAFAYQEGQTLSEVVAGAMAACNETAGAELCDLYALNSVVVMDFTR
jgi:hypothetical protein